MGWGWGFEKACLEEYSVKAERVDDGSFASNMKWGLKYCQIKNVKGRYNFFIEKLLLHTWLKGNPF